MYGEVAGAFIGGGLTLRTFGPRSSCFLRGRGGFAKPVVFMDEVSQTRLRGRSFAAGLKVLTNVGLKLVKGARESGRREFVDSKGKIRVMFDPGRYGNSDHWHKVAPDYSGSKLNDAGKVVDPGSGAAHIPAR